MILLALALAAAPQSRVAEVVVYPDRAQVTRALELPCAPGAVAVFEGLPPTADQGSFRARAKGGEILCMDSFVEAYGHADDFKGFLFDNFDQYWDASPLKYAKNVKTPTLILHSDNDFRVPLEQGEQWFRALKHYGVTTELVIFPRENHNLTRTGEPKHLVESLNWQLYWFDKYLLP